MNPALINTRDIVITATTRERFDASWKVDDASGCWVWKRSVRNNGYGQIFTGSKRDRTHYPAQAHRVAYLLYRGPIPDGMVIDHLCRNPLCVNPAHLEVVTLGENTRRGQGIALSKARAAAKTHCSAGHPLTTDNVYVVRSKGWRRCVICMNAYNRAWAARKPISFARQRLTVRSLIYRARTKAGLEAYAALREMTLPQARESLMAMHDIVALLRKIEESERLI